MAAPLAENSSPMVIKSNMMSPKAALLWNLVIATAEAMGTDPPDEIMGCTEANFYASIGKMAGGRRSRILYVSIPLSNVLTVPEYHAIIAHEMAHFRAQDAEFSLKFYAPYRKGMDTLTTMSASASSSRSGLEPSAGT